MFPLNRCTSSMKHNWGYPDPHVDPLPNHKSTTEQFMFLCFSIDLMDQRCSLSLPVSFKRCYFVWLETTRICLECHHRKKPQAQIIRRLLGCPPRDLPKRAFIYCGVVTPYGTIDLFCFSQVIACRLTTQSRVNGVVADGWLCLSTT